MNHVVSSSRRYSLLTWSFLLEAFLDSLDHKICGYIVLKRSKCIFYCTILSNSSILLAGSRLSGIYTDLCCIYIYSLTSASSLRCGKRSKYIFSTILICQIQHFLLLVVCIRTTEDLATFQGVNSALL